MVVWFSHTDDYFLRVQILQEYGGVLNQIWEQCTECRPHFPKNFVKWKRHLQRQRPTTEPQFNFFLDTHLLQVSNISSVQPPPASGANPPEPHLVGGQSHKSVVRFRHFASLPLLHLHGVLPPDKLYKNSPNSDKTRPAAAKLCHGPTWWAVPSVGDFIHQIYLQVISTSSSCRGG